MLQVFPGMLDPDGFFHAKMALLTLDQGFVSSFSFLPETLLSFYWTDQHWLYHVFLIPFVIVLDPLWGVKVAALFLGVAYILVFYTVLSKILLSKRMAFWWSIVLLTASPFVFRLILVKAQPFAFILLLIGLFLFIKRKHIRLGVVQFLYVLSHGSFLLLPFLIGWSLIFSLLFDRKELFINRLTILKSILALFLGTLFGVVVQPTFPENIMFYWHQMVSIGLVGVSELTATGLEWKSISLLELMIDLSLISVVTCVTFIVIIIYRKVVPKKVYWWLWLILPLTVLSLRSIRNIELLVPILIISIAYTWKFIPLDGITKFVKQRQYISMIIGGTISFAIAIWVILPLVIIYNLQASPLRLTAYEKEASYIEAQANSNSIVVNTSWDIFPMLFYYTTDKSFISGLDPAFLFIQNSEVYKNLVTLREDRNVDPLFDRLGKAYENIILIYFSTTGDDFKKPTSSKYEIMETLLDENGSIFSIDIRN